MKNKVLLIDVNCRQGSTGKIVYDLYTEGNKNGFEMAIAYGRGPKVDGINILKFGLDWETWLHAILTRITGYTGCYSYFSTKRLLKFIQDFNPDVVHIHELHAYFVNIKQLINYLKEHHIKTIHTLHCEFSYTGKCGYSCECEKWQTSCRDCPNKLHYPKTYVDHTHGMFEEKKELFSNFPELSLVSPSKWLANRIKKSFLACYPIAVIHNGIDTEIFHRRDTTKLRKALGIKEYEKVVLAVAPDLMNGRKGGRYVIELANQLKDKPIRFVLVGVNGNGIGNDNNVEGNIVTIKPIRNQELLSEFYSLGDVFIICSERENFPTTCLEAQCCGTPVFGFDVGGTAETCLSKGMHFVRYADMSALCSLIEDELFNTDEHKEQLEELARKHYGRDAFASKMFALYRNR